MIFLYVIIGVLSGIISGMGIGGGAILIPSLTIILGVAQRDAQNINLIYFIPTAAIALVTHFKSGNIETRKLPTVILFGLAGAVAGSLIAVRLDQAVLKRIFGFFLLGMGVYEFFKARSVKNGN